MVVMDITLPTALDWFYLSFPAAAVWAPGFWGVRLAGVIMRGNGQFRLCTSRFAAIAGADRISPHKKPRPPHCLMAISHMAHRVRLLDSDHLGAYNRVDEQHVAQRASPTGVRCHKFETGMTEQVQNVPRYGWSLLRRALIILATVIASLLLMEIGARIFVNIMVNRQKHRAEMPLLDFDPITRYARSGIYWRLKPNLNGVRIRGYVGNTPFECSVSTDARGFRGPLVLAGDDAIRFLAIGDSTTFGLGVEGEKAWPALLNEILRSKGKQVEVVNAGVCGYSVDQGLAFLESHGFALAPDLVVATFGYNDRCDWGFNLCRFWSSRAVILLRAALSYVGIGGPDGEDQNVRPRLTPGEFLDTLLEMEAAWQQDMLCHVVAEGRSRQRCARSSIVCVASPRRRCAPIARALTRSVFSGKPRLPCFSKMTMCMRASTAIGSSRKKWPMRSCRCLAHLRSAPDGTPPALSESTNHG